MLISTFLIASDPGIVPPDNAIKDIIMKFRVVIGGTKQAKKRWPARLYKLHSSARRRAKQIHQSNDLGVSVIWILPDPMPKGIV